MGKSRTRTRTLSAGVGDQVAANTNDEINNNTDSPPNKDTTTTEEFQNSKNRLLVLRATSPRRRTISAPVRKQVSFDVSRNVVKEFETKGTKRGHEKTKTRYDGSQFDIHQYLKDQKQKLPEKKKAETTNEGADTNETATPTISISTDAISESDGCSSGADKTEDSKDDEEGPLSDTDTTSKKKRKNRKKKKKKPTADTDADQSPTHDQPEVLTDEVLIVQEREEEQQEKQPANSDSSPPSLSYKFINGFESVSLTVFISKSLNTDAEILISERHCTIKFRDGSVWDSWSMNLLREINVSQSSYKKSDVNVTFTLIKKDAFEAWKSIGSVAL